MKPISAENEHFTKIKLHGVEGYWSDLRIDPSTIPAGYELFETRDTDDCTCEPCEIAKHILVNFCGSFIVPTGSIVLPKDDPAIYIDFDDEYDTIDYLNGELYTVKNNQWVLEN